LPSSEEGSKPRGIEGKEGEEKRKEKGERKRKGERIQAE